MRRIRRDNSGGEVAMMAVITKAMGAFLVMMLLLMPYYITDPQAEKTVEEASEQIDKAKEKIEEAREKVKEGKLTQEELDDLLRRLDEAIVQLEEARLNIQQLKTKVDQYASQVNRLNARVDELESENANLRDQIKDLRQQIADLKQQVTDLQAEVERLRKNQGGPPPDYWNVVRMDWNGCAGAQLNLYVSSDIVGEKGDRNPPPNRKPQGAYFKNDNVRETGSGASSGTIVWYLGQVRTDEVFTLYVKYLNALPGGPRECQLNARWNNFISPGQQDAVVDSVQGRIGEQNPYVILARLKAGPRGEMSMMAVTGDEQQKFASEIKTSECQQLSCGLGRDETAMMFVNTLSERFIGELVPPLLQRSLGPQTGPSPDRVRGDALMTELAMRYAAGGMSYADVGRWVRVLSGPIRPQPPTKATQEAIDGWVRRLTLAKAPEPVIILFKERATAGRYDPRAMDPVLRDAGIPILPEDEAQQRRVQDALAEWRRKGLDGEPASSLARLNMARRISLETTNALAELLVKSRDQPMRTFVNAPEARELMVLLRELDLDRPLEFLFHPAGGSKIPPAESLPVLRQIQLPR